MIRIKCLRLTAAMPGSLNLIVRGQPCDTTLFSEQ
jgi:hypothetical protein